MTKERVDHPSHYTWLKEKCGIEVIDITRHMGFDLGNVVKYVVRAGHKEEADMTLLEKQIEDLEKAAWYLNDEIMQLKLNLQKQSDQVSSECNMNRPKYKAEEF